MDNKLRIYLTKEQLKYLRALMKKERETIEELEKNCKVDEETRELIEALTKLSRIEKMLNGVITYDNH